MRRIIVEYEKCDGCKNCSVACMQAHRESPGTVYDLDLTSPENESRNFIYQAGDGTYRRRAGVRDVLYERRVEKGRGQRTCHI